MDGVNHITYLSHTSSDGISFFFEEEIWDKGDGNDNMRNLSLAGAGPGDEKIDELMNIVRSIMSTLEN